MRHLVLFLLPAFLLTSACQSKKNSEATEANAEEKKIIDLKLPFLSSEEVNKLYATAEKVDMIFYELPISVNQEEEASVKNTVLYIVPASPRVTAQCKPLGRLAWLADGVILREADVFVGEGCQYLLFMENNQPAWANAIAPEAIQFFNNITSQVNPRQK